MITGANLEHLCGILNSQLFIHYFSMQLSGDSYAYGSREFFSCVPVIKYQSEKHRILTELVNQVLHQENDSARLLDKINDEVYRIYEITDEERKYIENH